MLVFVLAGLGSALVVMGVVLGGFAIVQRQQLPPGSAELVLAGIGLWWAAAMLFSIIGMELRQLATFRADVSRAQRSPVTGSRECPDCLNSNPLDAERCATCRRFLR